MTDDLNDLLTIPRDVSPSPDFSTASWMVLERRRRSRQAMMGFLVVGLIVAAFSTGLSLRPAGQTVIEERVVVVPSSSESIASVIPDDPDRYEQQAELSDDPTVVALNYRLAGDAYLKRARFAEAERCYRLHLRSAGDMNRTTTDTWLLANLKITFSKGTL